MAQKDAKVNIALAESSAAIARASKQDSAIMKIIAIESKKDSSAMKTIAVLGMFFLPGTFVAVSSPQSRPLFLPFLKNVGTDERAIRPSSQCRFSTGMEMGLRL